MTKCPFCGGTELQVEILKNFWRVICTPQGCVRTTGEYPLLVSDLAQFFLAGASGVDVEHMKCPKCRESKFWIMCANPACDFEHDSRTINEQTLPWKKLPELPEEDVPVLIAVMSEADDHGSGETVRLPEVFRGTIYTAPSMVIAACDNGDEYENEQILGWQPLPAPPEAEQEESNG